MAVRSALTAWQGRTGVQRSGIAPLRTSPLVGRAKACESPPTDLALGTDRMICQSSDASIRTLA